MATALKEDAGMLETSNFASTRNCEQRKNALQLHTFIIIYMYLIWHTLAMTGPPGMQHKMANVQHASWHHQNTMAHATR